MRGRRQRIREEERVCERETVLVLQMAEEKSGKHLLKTRNVDNRERRGTNAHTKKRGNKTEKERENNTVREQEDRRKRE